jgi:hypothetical protein
VVEVAEFLELDSSPFRLISPVARKDAEDELENVIRSRTFRKRALNPRKADTKLKNIVSEIRKYIFDVFRAIHGESLYWDNLRPRTSARSDMWPQEYLTSPQLTRRPSKSR